MGWRVPAPTRLRIGDPVTTEGFKWGEYHQPIRSRVGPAQSYRLKRVGPTTLFKPLE